VNDGSTDESGEILREYAVKDARARVIEFDENKGVGAARNAGIEAAQGEYLGFVDSDDYVDENFYEELYSRARITGADIVKGKMNVINCDTLKPIIEDNQFYDINNKIRENKGYFYHSFTTAIYRINLIKENKIMFPTGTMTFEDPVFVILTMVHSKYIEIVDTVTYYYARHNTSITKLYTIQTYTHDIIQNINYLIEIFNKFNVDERHYVIVINFLYQALNDVADGIANCIEDDSLQDICKVSIIQLLRRAKYPEKLLIELFNNEYTKRKKYIKQINYLQEQNSYIQKQHSRIISKVIIPSLRAKHLIKNNTYK
jgi:glycosyltransferase involved in cell wall biosynthesis